MNSKNNNINFNNRYIIQKYDKSIILIKFTIEQDIYDDEEYYGMKAYECYILDNDDDEDESLVRGIYYYDCNNDKHFLKYYENYDDDTKTTITIYRILMIETNDTIEQTISKADEEDIGLCMGDIC
jgi:hypothetical protein